MSTAMMAGRRQLLVLGNALASAGALNGALDALTLEEGSVSTEEGLIFYRRAGTGRAVVLLLHGWPQSSYAWRRVMPLLARSYTVLAPDLPGFGASSKPSGGFDKVTIAARILRFLEELGVEEFALVGHDMGGQVGYAFAASWPDRVSHFVFIESGLPAFGQERAMDVANGGSFHYGFNMEADLVQGLVAGRERTFIDYIVNRQNIGLFDPTSLSDDDLEEYSAAMARPGALRCMCAYYQALKTDREDNERLGSRPLSIPVLAVGAEFGYAGQSADTMRLVASNVRSVIVGRSGHYVPEEQPERLAAELIQFFASTTS